MHRTICFVLFASISMISAELCGDTGMHTPQGMVCFENGFAQDTFEESVQEQAILAVLLIECKTQKRRDDEERKMCADGFKRAGYAREHFIQFINVKLYGQPHSKRSDHEKLADIFAENLYAPYGLVHNTEVRRELEEAHRIYLARRAVLKEAPRSLIELADIIMD